MLERVSRAVLTAGLSAAGCGLLYGLWTVGPADTDCGSAFFPRAQDNIACATAQAGRTNTAWLLIGLGGPVAAGAVVLTRESAPAKPSVEPAAPDQV